MKKVTIFRNRLVAPLLSDVNWVHVTHGGKNSCILVKDNSVLPNCVGYAWGRWLELLPTTSTLKLSRGNAENWWAKEDGYERGQTPKLGAVACWSKGKPGYSVDGAGHVSVVEKIFADGTIITSNSAWAGSRFYLRTLKPPYNIGTVFTFQGFIYPPVNFGTTEDVIRNIVEVALEVIGGKWGNGAHRKAKLKGAGYDYKVVQAQVNDIIKKKKIKSVDEVAKEVIDGKWGNGEDRRMKLRVAGYKPEAVQDRVNQLMSIANNTKSYTEVARDVIKGAWGNGKSRKKALEEAGYSYTAVQKEVNRLLK